MIEDRGITVASLDQNRFTIDPFNPLLACLETEYRLSFISGEANVESRATTVLTADKEAFHIVWHIKAYERGKLVHEAGDERWISRDPN